LSLNKFKNEIITGNKDANPKRTMIPSGCYAKLAISTRDKENEVPSKEASPWISWLATT